MPNIETAKQYSDRVVDEYVSSPLPVREVLLQNTTARDAAISAESAELLRVCGKALDHLYDAAENYSAEQESAKDKRCGNVQLITVAEGKQLNAALKEALSALAALKDAGRVKETLKNEQEAPHA